VTPPVSIIVPHRNHRACLPRLLESIQRQSLKDLEVLIVDDASESGCADIVDAFVGRGLRVRLLENERRLYVRDARLAGVREARSDCFMFADADDMLWGESALEAHVGMRQKHQADIVHFRSVLTDGVGNFAGHFSWADPLAPKLDGKAVFSAFTRSELEGSVIWNKIFSKALWLRIMSDLRDFPLKQASEDFFFNIWTFFAAQSYVGSELIGYGFHFCPEKQGAKSLMRAATLCRMLDLLMPRLREAGGDVDDLSRLECRLLHFLAVHAGRAGIHALEQGEALEDFVQEALAQEDCGTLIKTLLRGAGVNGKKLQTIYRSAQGL
jgi:glycosyltransferase involved in cell wall biosynthesis